MSWLKIKFQVTLFWVQMLVYSYESQIWGSSEIGHNKGKISGLWWSIIPNLTDSGFGFFFSCGSWINIAPLVQCSVVCEFICVSFYEVGFSNGTSGFFFQFWRGRHFWGAMWTWPGDPWTDCNLHNKPTARSMTCWRMRNNLQFTDRYIDGVVKSNKLLNGLRYW